jgi:RNA polymerase sigma-70 factor, ECF subfamily
MLEFVSCVHPSPVAVDAVPLSEGNASQWSDAEILWRVQAGERQLFALLYDRHHERVFRFVSRSVWQRENAQDIASEVWLRAYNAVDRFEVRRESSIVAWLLRIASNLVTDYRRRLGPECESWEESEETISPRATESSTERLFWKRERLRALRDAFGTLSFNDQQIIMLAHGRGLSSAQIAVVLGKPSISAVTSHLHRAMSHLREKLRRAGWDPGETLREVAELSL